MNRKKLSIIALTALVGLSAYSLVPVIRVYLKPDVIPPTNDQVIEKLKANTADYFGFVVFGDNHAGFIFNDSAALKLIKRINREDRFNKIPVDFVLSTGDVTFRGSARDWRVYNKLRSLIKFPTISAVGNHDDDKGGIAPFNRYIGHTEFSFTDRNAYFIVMDNRVNELSDAQLRWMEEELKKSSAYRHRFVVIHKGPVSLYQQSWYRPELSSWPRPFMALCERYKVDIVFSGHEHVFKKGRFNGVEYICSGGGGTLTQIPASDGGFLNYLFVRVNGDYVDYEMRKVAPPFWEYLAYYLWKDVFYILRDALF